MNGRSFAAGMLLALAMVFAGQVALDGPGLRVPHEHQWQASGHHSHALRLPRRSANGTVAPSPAAPALGPGGAVVLIASPDVLSPLLADIFVPPRV